MTKNILAKEVRWCAECGWVWEMQKGEQCCPNCQSGDIFIDEELWCPGCKKGYYGPSQKAAGDWYKLGDACPNDKCPDKQPFKKPKYLTAKPARQLSYRPKRQKNQT